MPQYRKTVRCRSPRQWSSKSRGFALTLALAAGLCCAGLSAHAQALAFEHDHDAFVPAWQASPQWSGKLLLQKQDDRTKSPLIDAVSLDGVRERIPFELPDAGLVQIDCMSGGADGSILVGGVALSTDSRGALFLAWISPDRKRRTVIRTEPFRSMAVTVAADGTIWAAGLKWDNVNRVNIAQNVLQRYDVSGKLLTSVLVPAAKAFVPSLGDATMGSYLLASADRVGWLTSGLQYIEYSLDGQEIGRFDGPPGVSLGRPYVALSKDNHLVMGPVRSAANAAGKPQVLELDRRGRTWAPVSMPDQVKGSVSYVRCFDGTTLVTADGPGALHWFKRVDSTAAK